MKPESKLNDRSEMSLPQRYVVDDLPSLIEVLPSHVKESLNQRNSLGDLLEVILDLGRPALARFIDKEEILAKDEIGWEDIQYVVDKIGAFGDDNRAGIERTLHRISAIRNRTGNIIGLTCRVGRAVYGTIGIIEDIIRSGENILFLGRPGVGKTTMLREVARVSADDAHKRVIIVDTSNEIAGDGDIPHPAIGGARRMQVVTPILQYAVMIEAVENHMPEVIVIDEMGTELEASAARTIAERGVQLIATAHGNTLDNLILNPTLADLIGGIQSVTLGDDEARRRRTQKTVLERKAPPTFDVVIEIQGWDKVAIHHDVSKVVDGILRGVPGSPETRLIGQDEKMHKSGGDLPEPPITGVDSRYKARNSNVDLELDRDVLKANNIPTTKILPFGLNKGRIIDIIHDTGMPIEIVDALEKAEILLTTKQFFKKRPRILKNAEDAQKSIFVLRKNSHPQIRDFLADLSQAKGWEDPVSSAITEAEDAAREVHEGIQSSVDLDAQGSHVRRIQHQIAQARNLRSLSSGSEPHRRVTISRR